MDITNGERERKRSHLPHFLENDPIAVAAAAAAAAAAADEQLN